MNAIRVFRIACGDSQATFAIRLAVAIESYRAWDTGRRLPPPEVLAQAEVLAAARPDDRPLGLPQLSRVLGVSVYRLREAARDGRLGVTYKNRVTYGHPIPQATRAAGEAYKRQFYGKKARWVAHPLHPRRLTPPPADFDQRLVRLRKALALSQAQLAQRIGAAGKAVVYQWESRKRRPSPLFWQKVEALESLLDCGS